jgi:hypothetical protein
VGTDWVRVGSEKVTTKTRVLLRCACGRESRVLVFTIIGGQSRRCRSCAAKARYDRVGRVGRLANPSRGRKPVSQDEDVRRTMTEARQRCTNENNASYHNYGGRGIQFNFPSVRAGVEWVIRELGPRPEGRTLDRIDNDGHYEPGNLRWATRSDQCYNRREFAISETGARIRALKKRRMDLTRETVRTWVSLGLTDEEILGKDKYARADV